MHVFRQFMYFSRTCSCGQKIFLLNACTTPSRRNAVPVWSRNWAPASEASDCVWRSAMNVACGEVLQSLLSFYPPQNKQSEALFLAVHSLIHVLRQFLCFSKTSSCAQEIYLFTQCLYHPISKKCCSSLE
ncbi:hypothetical protein JTE90_011444 [Oedothorax gibbosus]|uniref:Uncharacterized protein n=1 Tax=Oedothorax gibbosus TaxID=931172 RepID=A0AAV6VD21_9ARAC|nr:hypothetical protein JTE90_011444 [Oedothorax gibbosus]